MKTRKGLHGGAYKPLTESDIAKIHQASMQVFEEVGIQVNYPEALAAFQEAGAEIDHETNIVKLKADQVKRLLAEVPESIVLHGREPSGEHDLEIGGTKVYMGHGRHRPECSGGRQCYCPACTAQRRQGYGPDGGESEQYPFLHVERLSQRSAGGRN